MHDSGRILLVTIVDEHIGVLLNYILHNWPFTKAGVQNEAQQYWSFRDEIVVMHRITMKEKEK